MKELEIKTLSEFIDNTAPNPRIVAHPCFFRGVTNIEHQLIPSLGRMKVPDQDHSVQPLSFKLFSLEEFQKNATIEARRQKDTYGGKEIPLDQEAINRSARQKFLECLRGTEWDMLRALQERNRITAQLNNELEGLVWSQHHGVPTQFLDWTTNPLVALYFATRLDLESDGSIRERKAEQAAVYQLCFIHKQHCASSKDVEKFYHKFPSSLYEGDGQEPSPEFCFFHPPKVTERIPRQFGVLSFQKDPLIPLDELVQAEAHNMANNGKGSLNLIMKKIVFDKKLIIRFQRHLYQLGIRHETLFPDPSELALGLRIGRALDNPAGPYGF